MNQQLKRILTLMLFHVPVWLVAQGYQVHVQGQKQQGMANAGAAFVQDAAITYYNPGGVSFVRGNSVSMGGNVAIVKSAFLSTTGGGAQVNTTTPISTPITAYCVYGFDSSVVSVKVLQRMKFGLGVYTPFGGGISYPDQWIGRYLVNSYSFKTLSVQPTVSYNVGDKLGLGVGFVYSFGSLARNQDLPELDSDTSSIPNLDLSGKMKGIGFNAGVYFKPTDDLSFGFTYRSQTNMDIDKGTATITDVPALLADSLPNGSFTTTIPLPQVITLGAAYKVMEGLTVAADISFIGFKVFDSLQLASDNNTGAWQKLKKAQPRNFKNTYSFHLGGQYSIIEGLDARLGIRYVLSAVPYGETLPEGPDGNRFVYCVGAGYEVIEGLTVDASYNFEIVNKTDNNEYYRFAGIYKTYASVIGLSVSYKF